MLKTEKILLQNIGSSFSINKVKIDNFMINYLVGGSGEPLLLIHGSNIGWGQWYKNIKLLSRYFMIYAIDLPGSGNSTKIDQYNLIEKYHVKIVKDFISVMGLKNVNLIGHSLGGWISFQLKENISKIVLVSPIGFSKSLPFSYKLLSSKLFTTILANSVMGITRSNMTDFICKVIADKSCIDKCFIDYYMESLNNGSMNYQVNHPFYLINKITSWNGVDDVFIFESESISKMNIPSLIILGKNDPLTDINEVIRSVSVNSKISFQIFDGCGHVPPIEKSDLFNEVCMRFLKP